MKLIQGIVLAFWLAGAAGAQPYGALEKLPAWVDIKPNIPYDRYPQTVLDILRRKGDAAGNRPGMLVIHGGGWVRQVKERIVQGFCLPFVERGFVVANVEYRLGPVAPAPAAVTDVLVAAQWFHRHAREYGVDPNRIAVIGESAGAHLALMVGMSSAAAALGPVTKVAAVLDVFGVADVTDQLFGPHPMWYAQEWIPEQPHRRELSDRVSPLRYIRQGLPATLIIHGDSDEVVPYAQSRQLASGLRDAGVDVEFITVANGKHGFTVEQWEHVLPRIFQFLAARHLE
jgi:acetyl esterase/lipase